MSKTGWQRTNLPGEELVYYFKNGTINFLGRATFEQAAGYLLRRSKHENTQVTAKFEGCELISDPDTTFVDLEKQLHDRSAKGWSKLNVRGEDNVFYCSEGCICFDGAIDIAQAAAYLVLRSQHAQQRMIATFNSHELIASRGYTVQQVVDQYWNQIK